MTTTIHTIAGWDEINEAIVSANYLLGVFQAEQEPSADPASPFQWAQRELERLNGLALDLAAARLQQIDDDVAASNIVAEIEALAKQAKTEAEALKNAAKTVQGIADIIGKIAGVVTKIAGLPSLN